MINFIFFGSSNVSLGVLEALKSAGFLPTAIVTMPDSPQGRGLTLTPSLAKVWGEANNISVLTPQVLDEECKEKLRKIDADFFVVASYGKILSESILAIPKKGVLNMHPSLLPKYRGATPIPSQILNDDKEVGITIMEIDKEVDHGPIVAQKKIALPNWPVKSSELKKILSAEGGVLLADVLTNIKSIVPREQNHELATFTKKFEKEHGLLQLENDGYQNYLKFCAYEDTIGTYFFIEKKSRQIRVKIIDAEYKDGAFLPTRIVPEGGKEMNYADFLRGLTN